MQRAFSIAAHLGSMPRRYATGKVAFHAERIPVLEELFEPAVLRVEEMGAEAISELKGYIPPVMGHQIEASLTSEFGRPLHVTDWTQYKDPTSSWEQASRLLHNTLAIYSNLGRTRKWSQREDPLERATLNEQWVREECGRLFSEVSAGNYERWAAVESLIGPEWVPRLSDKQLAAVRPAVAIIGKNAALHPKTKQEIVSEICKVVHASI